MADMDASSTASTSTSPSQLCPRVRALTGLTVTRSRSSGRCLAHSAQPEAVLLYYTENVRLSNQYLVDLTAGAEKSTLVFCESLLYIFVQGYSLRLSDPQSFKTSNAYTQLGVGHEAHYYFDFWDVEKQDCYGLLSSVVSLLSAESDFCKAAGLTYRRRARVRVTPANTGQSSGVGRVVEHT